PDPAADLPVPTTTSDTTTTKTHTPSHHERARRPSSLPSDTEHAPPPSRSVPSDQTPGHALARWVGHWLSQVMRRPPWSGGGAGTLGASPTDVGSPTERAPRGLTRGPGAGRHSARPPWGYRWRCWSRC